MAKMAKDPFDIYHELQAIFAKDVKSGDNRALIGDSYRASCKFLSKAHSESLRSLVPGKDYFAFRQGRRLSRAVNKELFLAAPEKWEAFCPAIAGKAKPRMDTHAITQIIYSVAASFFAFVDLTKEGDQKTPGTTSMCRRPTPNSTTFSLR